MEPNRSQRQSQTVGNAHQHRTDAEEAGDKRRLPIRDAGAIAEIVEDDLPAMRVSGEEEIVPFLGRVPNEVHRRLVGEKEGERLRIPPGRDAIEDVT